MADEVVHYNDRGRVVNQYQCDSVNTHQSARQDTLVCSRDKRIPTSIRGLSMNVIQGEVDARNCQRNRNCVVINNPRDPHWIPIALTGIPDAIFGRNAGGKSCAVIRESKPSESTWASQLWRLCTNSPNVEIAYTYALGHSNENVDRRFKTKQARQVCFSDVLQGYKHRKFWKDNCIFIRPAGRPAINAR